MQDYEEYGSSFRTPRQYRDDGGPANNGNGFDPEGAPSRPEGRPRGSDVDRARRGFGGDDINPQRKPHENTPQRRPSFDAENPQEPQAPAPTFRELQRDGRARPPRPQPTDGQVFAPSAPAIAIRGGTMANSVPQQLSSPPTLRSVYATQGGIEERLRGEYDRERTPQRFSGQSARVNAPGAFRGQNFDYEGERSYAPEAYQGQGYSGSMSRTNAPRAYQGSQFNGSASRIAAPEAYQGSQFNGQYNRQAAPQQRETGGFQAPTSRVNQATEQSVLQGLANPSRWDNAQIKSSYDQLAGGIDDDYNARDQRLTGSMAQRGMGAVGDTTIGSNDARYQNLQRRTAKGDALRNVMENAANTQSADRAQAVSAGMGYGGQEFNQNLSGYETNRSTNAQNFGQDTSRAQFGADEEKAGYDRNFSRSGFNNDVGQQGFQNRVGQAATENELNQRDYSNQLNNAGFNNTTGQQGYENQFKNSQFDVAQNQDADDRGFRNAGFNNATGQQGYENRLQGTEFNANQAQKQYQNRFSNAGYNNQVGQQGYQNQFQGTEFNQRNNQQQYENDARNFGVNQNASQYEDQQRQLALNNLLGYGQQSFNNQQSTAEFNSRQQQQEWENLQKMMGY